MPSPRVAIVDIGSNSIKVLVAERNADGSIAGLLTKTLDARIGAGISKSNPRLTPESIERGLNAIQELLSAAAPFTPKETILVATSAVRDAGNGADFRERVHAVTGHRIRILTGEEEASFIGRGLTCDNALSAMSDFYVFDLGGGSLECLAFRNRQIEQALSLQLGCVRLTEKFIPNAERTIQPHAIDEIAHYTGTQLHAASFDFSLPQGAIAVGTGGTVTTVRAILAARAGITLEQTNTRIEVSNLKMLLAEVAAQTLAERKKVAGLPPGRADVFPTALATLIAVAEAGDFTAYQHSFYNLRYGLAAEALERM